jgi:proline dehydrogenase
MLFDRRSPVYRSGHGMVIRRAVDMAAQIMREQFIAGRTTAPSHRRLDVCDFRCPCDRLGEAAITAATRYYSDYGQAIHAIPPTVGDRGRYGTRDLDQAPGAASACSGIG